MEIEIYYGMSGALKGTTIESFKNKDSTIKIVESKIKSWKDYENGLFKDMIPYSDLNYSILHLTELERAMEDLRGKIRPDRLLIERGITDSIFYHYWNTPNLDIWVDFVKNAVRREEICLLSDFFKIRKILLIQKDKNFIRDYVLKENHRKQIFPDVESYIKRQESYVNFTKTYNSIDETIEINNAKEYIESLGLIFNN